jgi:hypothetical protein
LLRKPHGRLEAEGARFHWSAGILLCERSARFEGGLRESTGGFAGPLGRWTIPRDLEAASGGERRKKEFQALAVPQFFRSGIPMVRHAGATSALLPARLAGRLRELNGVHFEPSPLARWWLGLPPS